MPWYYTTTFEVTGNTIDINHRVIYNLYRFQILSIKEDVAGLTLHDLANHTGSDASLDQARRWLGKCIDSHQDCGSDRDITFRPSRLLYLGSSDIRLHTSQDYPDDLRYMTLSHCWGRLQSTRLQQGNLDFFRRNAIPQEALPKTFRDAIRLARHLGADYLWIDRLCIIQDSLEDWQAESVMMGEVYRNSLCNIAATTALDSSEGCLYPRDPRMLQPTPLVDGFYLCNRTSLDHPYHLYTRAWVLQEILLAPRTLHCADSQLYWSCDGMRVSEEFSGGFTGWTPSMCNHPFHGSSKGFVEETLRAMIVQMRTADEDLIPSRRGPRPFTLVAYLHTQPFWSSAVRIWGQLVDIYTRTDLTFDTDRPMAIAGAADAFRPYLGDYR
ncbi:heterokaryon incompatibility protein-domain-containing protein [Microdochium trichocladiopsis]|uniref:Heterokaryon incompatibility protein-domain-containing protein n=1 Tax=Microdochium trichocladiopsis TaxID=1682393 RepID=A0A9P8Y649_9PEZI|nr:heterokaryon incompatibility protein-domain-containing protein [Microdochium trichocladiopsis]KAH7028792.1 heterokaryon incompatibility protein-domain-containing protein [Microdochium trichocladiopsis]